MKNSSRRRFLKSSALGIAGSVIPLAHLRSSISDGTARQFPFQLGMTSYTFRAFNLDQAILMTKRLNLSRISLKDVHLALSSSDSKIAEAVAKVRTAGLELSALGVIYMKSEAEVNRAFSYAQAAGVRMFVGVPEPELLPLTEGMAKATQISVAIHNHGPTDKTYPSPESVYSRISALDPLLGLCIDVGHTQRLGLDPAHEAQRFADRLLDVHLKDVSSNDVNGTTVEIGRGVIDIPKLLGTLARINFGGTLHFEHEKDEKDPLPGVAESVGYTHGVLEMLGRQNTEER